MVSIDFFCRIDKKSASLGLRNVRKPLDSHGLQKVKSNLPSNFKMNIKVSSNTDGNFML